MLPTKFQVSWPYSSGEEVKNRFPSGHLGFLVRTILAIFFLRHLCFLPRFKSIGLSVQKKRKIDVQDDHHGGHLGFLIRTILGIFDLPVTPMLSTQFPVNSDQEKKWKIDFQDGHYGGHLGCLIWMILTVFDLQVTPMLPTRFRDICPFGSREEAKHRFSRWSQWWPFWNHIYRNDFSYFWSTSTPNASY